MTLVLFTPHKFSSCNVGTGNWKQHVEVSNGIILGSSTKISHAVSH